MTRRIDALYCSTASAEKQIKSIVAEIHEGAASARAEVEHAIQERIAALQARQQRLFAEIEEIAAAKVEVLQHQLLSILNGTCPPAPSEDPDGAPDPDLFVLETDAFISFRLGESDILETISGFGMVSERSTYASRSFAKGPALSALKVHNPSYLWVYACDREGSRREQGGDIVNVTMSSPEDFENLAVEDLKDGRYKVTFVPLSPGDFQLRIAIGPEGAEEDVHGSPFNVEVRPPTDYQQLGAEESVEGKVRLGDVHDRDLHSSHSLGSVHHPSGVAFDHTGRYVFVVDQSNHRVQVFDSATQEAICAFGKKGFGPLELDMPCGVVADRENQVVVTDLLNHRLQLLEFLPRTPELRHVCSIGGVGVGPSQFQFPKGLSLNEQGHLLVCDSGNHRVQVFDVADKFRFIREFGSQGTGDGQFDAPLDVAVSCTGDILVSDSNNRIQVFDPQGVFQWAFGSKGRKDGCFNYPSNIAVNDENALFVCDQGNHRVQVFKAADGSFLHKWGGTKKKKAEPADDDVNNDDGAAPDNAEGSLKAGTGWTGLRSPSGIAVNARGLVMVADYHSDVIYAF